LNPWQIRPLTASDVDKFFEIEQDLFPKPWNRTSYLDELTCENSYNFSVKSANAGENPPVIAYICFRVIIDEMHLLKIGVARKWQNKGIATWLFQQSIQMAFEKGATAVYLEVRVSNMPAISLYHKLGFTLIGKRPRYYPETGEDALVLMKQIY
jgi:ribosomal-protein-alanine N-acetyltransferase